MKYYYFKIVLAFCLFFSMNAFAEEVTVGLLKYELNGTEAYVSGYVGEPTNVVIPETIESDGLTFRVTQILDDAFTSCNSITSLTSTGTNLWYVGDNAFNSCQQIEEVNIYCQRIGYKAFYNCSNLKKVVLSGVNTIGLGNYQNGAHYLKRNYNVQSGYTFANCPNLVCIDLGRDLVNVSMHIFQNCKKISYIVIPSSCKHYYLVGASASEYIVSNYSFDNYLNMFSGCTHLQSIIYLGDQTLQCGSNATIYHPKDQVHWSSTEFDYQGVAPTVTFTSDMPAGFIPTAYDMPALEKDAGAYTQNVPFTFTNNDMSFEVDIPYNYTITPITLKAKVVDASREYGDANPEFTSTYTGFVNNEDAGVLTSHGAFTTTAKTISDVGTYVIKQSGATAHNYVFEYEDGKLTINKAPLTMTANNKTITYGNKLPSFDVTYTGLKNNETKPKWTKTPIISSTATADSDAGTYPIEINDADATNYTLTTANGTLTINKAALSIKADNKNKLYGEMNPELTCSYVGFVKNQTDAVLNSKPQLNTTATTNSAVGIYPIEVSGAEATNYSISYQNAELTINKRELSVTANNYTRAYGEENPEFELTYQGFVNNEDESVLKAKPVATTSATSTSDVGEYSIIVGNGVADNYNFQYINGKLTIEKAYQTLTWDQDFSDVKINDLIELTAEASSGLEITYSIESGQGNRIWKSQNKQYLECIEAGEVVIVAIQNGNGNYRESNKIYKTIVINGPTNIINGHEYVDLGLASGNLWAKTNYGSNTSEGYGTYLDWGDKDLISSQWGTEWTTPSLEDIRELENSCSWTWDSMNGHYGYLVKGNNGNSIFLPACGYKMMGQSSAKKVGEWVYYWTSTQSGEMASIIMCTSSNVWYGEMNISYTKLPIRPVAIGTSSDLRGIKLSSNENSQENIYDMKGQKLNGLKKGLNIIKYKDGTTKKIIVK